MIYLGNGLYSDSGSSLAHYGVRGMKWDASKRQTNIDWSNPRAVAEYYQRMRGIRPNAPAVVDPRKVAVARAANAARSVTGKVSEGYSNVNKVRGSIDRATNPGRIPVTQNGAHEIQPRPKQTVTKVNTKEHRRRDQVEAILKDNERRSKAEERDRQDQKHGGHDRDLVRVHARRDQQKDIQDNKHAGHDWSKQRVHARRPAESVVNKVTDRMFDQYHDRYDKSSSHRKNGAGTNSIEWHSGNKKSKNATSKSKSKGFDVSSKVDEYVDKAKKGYRKAEHAAVDAYVKGKRKIDKGLDKLDKSYKNRSDSRRGESKAEWATKNAYNNAKSKAKEGYYKAEHAAVDAYVKGKKKYKNAKKRIKEFFD